MSDIVERLGAGKCPECSGWGEVVYFGGMVACKCHGKYERPISMATRTEAAETILALRAEVEALRGALGPFARPLHEDTNGCDDDWPEQRTHNLGDIRHAIAILSHPQQGGEDV